MRSLIKYSLVVIWLLILVTPPIIFVQNNSWSVFSEPLTMFPIFGLMAFTLIWSQIMLGSFMRPLEKIYPKILPLHIFQGLFALGFAGTHWLLLFTSFLPDRIADYLGYKFVSPEMKSFVMFGQAALLFLVVGLAAGLLREWAPLKRYWHWVHLVHYIVFFLVFFHSINLGSDLHSTPILTNLWYFFFITVVIGFVYRRIYIPSKEGLVKSTS